MYRDIIKERLQEYAPNNERDEENAVKEIIQELVLLALARSQFFLEASFQGGTALRIFYQLKRFSEDLDFSLNAPSQKFNWNFHIQNLTFELSNYGIEVDIINKSKSHAAVQTLVLKENSLVKTLNFRLPQHKNKRIMIKIEVDVNPPMGARSEIKFLTFPIPFSIIAHDLPSLMAGKSHALLCRKFVKGRDWFDFIWYVSKGIKPNFDFLSAALNQSGPWQNHRVIVGTDWYIAALKERISVIDWRQAAMDVMPFLHSNDQKQVTMWGKEFFFSLTDKLKEYLV